MGFPSVPHLDLYEVAFLGRCASGLDPVTSAAVIWLLMNAYVKWSVQILGDVHKWRQYYTAIVPGPGWCDDVWREGVGDDITQGILATAGMRYILWDHV